jgi:hypothetical protein
MLSSNFWSKMNTLKFHKAYFPLTSLCSKGKKSLCLLTEDLRVKDGSVLPSYLVSPFIFMNPLCGRSYQSHCAHEKVASGIWLRCQSGDITLLTLQCVLAILAATGCL